MIKKILSLGLLMIISSSLFAKSVNVVLGGKFTITDGDVTFYALINNRAEGIPCINANSWRWGALRRCPLRYTSFLGGTVKDIAFFIPYSAFSDLADPVEFIVAHNSKPRDSFSLKVIGGETHTSAYQAILLFKADGTLINKEVRSIASPHQAWERTTYGFAPPSQTKVPPHHP